MFEIDGAEVLAVAAILPTDFGGRSGLTFKIERAEDVTAILTLDRVLTRSEETFFMFRAEDSHVGCSL